MNKKFPKLLILLLLGAAALVAGLFFYHSQETQTNRILSEKDLITATLLKQPRSIHTFSLQNMHEKPFTSDSLKGHWSLVFFGFTHCPSICPTALANLNQVYKKLEKKGVKNIPKVFFVSVDPEEDTPQVLRQYLSHFNPHFVGVTGSESQIHQLAQNLGAVYMEVEGEGPDAESTIDHSASIFVIDPNGQFYALFSSPNEVNAITTDLYKIIQ